MTETVAKVLVAHPVLGIINACRSTLSGSEVISATNLDEVSAAIAQNKLSGVIIYGDIEGKDLGLIYAAMLHDGYLPQFEGVVVGMATSVEQFDEFATLGIPSSNNHAYACKQLADLLETAPN